MGCLIEGLVFVISKRREMSSLIGRPARFIEMADFRMVSKVSILFLLVLAIIAPLHGKSRAAGKKLPNHVVPRRSSQIHDGFGINADLPRDPSLPWNRWWWTRIFDAGINFVRIGQYENSSDYTSWDWVERKRAEYSMAPDVEDQIDSLVENGVHIVPPVRYIDVSIEQLDLVFRRP